MYRKLIINDTEHESRVAVIEDGILVELFIERRDISDIAGNIYKGKVQRVLPGMQAAFVDIGLARAAFIYSGDTLEDNHKEIKQLFIENSDLENGKLEDDIVDCNRLDSSSTTANRNYPIEDLITEGQEIMVQVAKSPIGSKGPRVTSYISLPGRFLVLMPNSGHIGISRRIEDNTERNRLKDLISSLRKDCCGYIIRTAGEGVREEKLAYEMGFLKTLWENIQQKFKTAPAPSLLHKELSIGLRAVRDLLTQEADKVIIDSRDSYESVLSFLDTFMPSLQNSVEFHEGPEPIFDAYNIEGDISRTFKKKVWLKSGGCIVFEHTEALVAIDVNTGRYVGKHNFEETILKTNLEAVKEIAYQIRLRDIGGIIVIDFIDMEKKSNREKVFNALKEALQKDRRKTNIIPISELGLIQMTRKRTKKPFASMLCEPCFYCEGEGYLLSRQSICYNIYREIIRESYNMQGRKFALKVNPEIAELLHGEENHLLTSLERKIGKQIEIYPTSKFHIERFDIIEILE